MFVFIFEKCIRKLLKKNNPATAEAGSHYHLLNSAPISKAFSRSFGNCKIHCFSFNYCENPAMLNLE